MKRRSSAGGERIKAQSRRATAPKRRNAPKGGPRTHLEDELGEAWEQQTATSEILKIISSSPASVQVVLDTVVANAARLLDIIVEAPRRTNCA